jgi:hypothetical protein
MTSTPELTSGEDAASRVAALLSSMWLARARNGEVPYIRCEQLNLALVVGERSYRWSCVACAWLSPWFRPIGHGVVCIVGGMAIRDDA